jgi:peptidase E
MKSSVIGSGPSNYEVTPHNTITPIPVRKTETTDDMLREYLLHIFQYGTPEERIKIIGGINSRFILTARRLVLA